MSTAKQTSPLVLFFFFVFAFVVGLAIYEKLVEPLLDAAYARWMGMANNNNANIIGNAVSNSILAEQEQQQ